MDAVNIAGLAVVGTVLAVLLGQYKPEYRLFTSLITGTVILLAVIAGAAPLFEELAALLEATQMPGDYLSILLKALGICFLTQLAADTCKDAGEGAIASKVEMAGKVLVLLLSLPLFEEILSIAGSLFTL